jgi:hypothetical protein
MTMSSIHLNERATATILAALRCYQQHLEGFGRNGKPDPALADVATDGGTHEPMTAPEIDALCEAINAEPVPALRRWRVPLLVDGSFGCEAIIEAHSADDAKKRLLAGESYEVEGDGFDWDRWSPEPKPRIGEWDAITELKD